MRPFLAILVAIQLACAAKLAIGTIGFDHRGTTGLDLDGGIQLGLLYVLLVGVGGVWALVKREWVFAAIQGGVLICVGIRFVAF